MTILAEQTIAADGNGAAVVLTNRCPFQVDVFGTWGGGTVTLQYSPDNGTTWITIQNVSLSANGNSGPLGGVQGDKIRTVTAGSTAPSLTVYIRETIATR